MSSERVVEVQSLSVSADSVEILRRVDFALSRGELLLVVGRSGSGKTTLLRALLGIAPELGLKVRGRVRVLGSAPGDVRALQRIVYVPQEPWFAIASPYPLTELLTFTKARLSDIVEVCKRLGIVDKLESNTMHLSPGEVQRLLIAEARLSSSSLLIIDEATSYLDPEARREVAKLVRELVDEGAAAIVVDHDIDLWRGLHDRVLELYGGEARLLSDVVESRVFEELQELKRVLRGMRRCSAPSRGSPVLEVEDLWFRFPDADDYIIKGLTFSVLQGSMTLLKGVSGRGKTTLLRILAGLYRPTKGRVRVLSKPQLVPENPLLYLSSPTVAEELRGDLELAKMVGLEHRFHAPIGVLSSGERRRLAVASAFSRSPRVVLIDEPSVGLDPWSAIQIVRILDTLRRRGCAVVVASHDPLFLEVCDEVVHL